MKPENDINPVEIFAGTQWETTMIKSLLENEGIEVFLENEFMGTLNPWHTSAGGVNPIKVIVSSKNLDKAIQIIKDYQKNLKEGK